MKQACFSWRNTYSKPWTQRAKGLKSVASSGSINDFIFIAATSNNNDDILLPTLAIYILNYSCRLWQSYLSIYYCQHRQYIFWIISADYGNLIYWSIIGGFGVLPHCIECIRVLWNKEHIGHIRHVEYNINVGDPGGPSPWKVHNL